MNLLLEPEQEMIRQSAANFLAGEFPVARLHRGLEVFSPEIRRQFAELGWFGMALPEDAGGVGYTVVEEMLVFRECGRVLANPGVLAAVLAARLALQSGHRELLARLLAGDIAVGLALPDVWPADPKAAPERFRLFAAEGASLVISVNEGGATLFDIDGITLEVLPSLDKSVSMAVASLEHARVVASSDDSRILICARLLTAAMLQGAAEAMRDMIVEYAKVRQTFGRPIGAYQAVRHPCADMALRAEEARCQLLVGAIALRDQRDDRDVQVAAAKMVANTAAIKNADWNIQLHGGIGVTDEHDAHLYLKRVQLLSRFFGSDKALARMMVAASATSGDRSNAV